MLTATLTPVPRPVKGNSPHPANSKQGREVVRALTPGKVIRGKLQGCATYSYKISLTSGQLLRVTVLEQGSWLFVTLSSPDGQSITSSLGNRFAAEMLESSEHRLSWVAHTSGDYVLRLQPESKFCYLPPRTGEPPHLYEVRVQPLVDATLKDGTRVVAERALQRAFNFQEQNTAAAEQSAVENYSEALKLWRMLGDRSEEVRVLIHLGVFFEWQRHDPRKALEYYNAALSVARSANDRPQTARLLETVGEAYLHLGEKENGQRYYEQALSLRREIGDRAKMAELLARMSFHGLVDQVNSESEYEQQRLDLVRALRDRPAEIDALMVLSYRYQNRGEERKALSYLLQALPLHQQVYGERGQFDIRNDIALLYASLGERKSALEYFNRNLALSRTPGDPQRKAEGDTLNDLAYAHIKWGEYGEAVELLKQALTVYRSISHRAHEAVALNNLGFAYSRLDRPRLALDYYNQALVIHRETGELVSEGDTLGNMMNACKAINSPRLAIFYGKQAVNAYQAYRVVAKGRGVATQRSFINSKAEIYHQLAELLISEGRLLEARQVLDLLKEEEYFNFLEDDRTRAAPTQGRARPTSTEAEWEKRYREIADRVTSIGRRRGELLGKKNRTPDEERQLEQLEADLAISQRAFQNFLDHLYIEFGRSELAKERVFRLEEAQGLMEDLRELGPGVVVLYTLVGQEKYRVILITADAQKAYEYPIGAAELRRKVAAFRESLQNPSEDPTPLAQEMYRILLGPAAADLKEAGAETLMWSLDGVLRYVPVAALHDGERYMVERFRNVVFTPASQTRLKDLPTDEWRGLGLGVSKPQLGFASLPDVPEELESIIHDQRLGGVSGGVLPGKIMLDEAFTEAAMRSELRQGYPVVHIASHFSFHPGDDEDSFLLLGDGHHLSLADIKTSTNLFGGVELLTLSACETAVSGGGADGRELEGFGVLAQRQGAKAVIATLWPVADKSTRELMQEFYRARGTRYGLFKAEALRQAQLSLLRGGQTGSPAGKAGDAVTPSADEGRNLSITKSIVAGKAATPFTHPYYWAPFILIGNWK